MHYTYSKYLRGDIVIVVENLVKEYKLSGEKSKKLFNRKNKKVKKAVKGISFQVNEGEIFGLLGPNGAGKTSTLRCMATLMKPTEGSIKVLGHDTVKESEAIRGQMAFLTNDLKLDPHFTVDYTLDYYGQLYSMGIEEIGKRKEIIYEKFEMDKFKNIKISELSTGMSQKLSIAVSLIHDPKVIIFDEPTNGLDIITAKTVVEYLLELKKQGKVIIISTHIMSVAAKLCDTIAIILDGEIMAKGSQSHIYSLTETDNLEDAFFQIYYGKEGGKDE